MARSRGLSQSLDIQNLACETAVGFKTLEPNDAAIECHARKCVALAQISKRGNPRLKVLASCAVVASPSPSKPAILPRDASRSQGRAAVRVDIENSHADVFLIDFDATAGLGFSTMKLMDAYNALLGRNGDMNCNGRN
jgi:hypothetical protein